MPEGDLDVEGILDLARDLPEGTRSRTLSAVLTVFADHLRQEVSSAITLRSEALQDQRTALERDQETLERERELVTLPANDFPQSASESPPFRLSLQGRTPLLPSDIASSGLYFSQEFSQGLHYIVVNPGTCEVAFLNEDMNLLALVSPTRLHGLWLTRKDQEYVLREAQRHLDESRRVWDEISAQADGVTPNHTTVWEHLES